MGNGDKHEEHQNSEIEDGDGGIGVEKEMEENGVNKIKNLTEK